VEFKHGQAFQHIEKGQHLERLGRMDEAMLEFKRAVEADPSVASAHNALGQHYQRKGLLTKAADEYRSAAMLNGDYEGYFNLGRALSELERYDEAAEAFQQCLTIDSKDPTARYEAAFVQCAQGKFDEGLPGFQALVTEFPDDWELELAVANCFIGMGKPAEAERTLRQALANVPAGTDVTPVRDALLMSLHSQEFPDGKTQAFKEHLYVEYGVVGLGSGGDDGLDVPVYQDPTFTYHDVAVTLSRLLALVRDYGWPISAVASVDSPSLPIAVACSELLGVPVLEVKELHADDLVLVVAALAAQPELCEVTLEHMPAQHLSFAFAVPEPLDDGLISDFIGVSYSGKCVLPWQRLRKRSPSQAALSLLRALTIMPEEDNLPQQLAYYTEQHRLLRFFDVSAELEKRG